MHTQGIASFALEHAIGLLLTSSAAAQQFKQAWLHSPCTMIQPALAKSEIKLLVSAKNFVG